jgi:PncC family amidohydrolase
VANNVAVLERLFSMTPTPNLSLDTLAEQVGSLLGQKRLTIATAESCTGGLIANHLTNIAGSSAYFLGAVVCYANTVKESLLGVSAEALLREGAVSEIVAAQMAKGVLASLGTDLALSVTGIAGPGGGSAAKPVGLTYIGLASRAGHLQVVRQIWQSDRVGNKQQSAAAALQLALAYLQSG